MELNDMDCCGLGELSGISNLSYGSTADDLFFELCENHSVGTSRGSFFSKGGLIFTQAGNKNTKYGFKFAEYIEANELGLVTVLPPFRNPNTGNTVITFFWQPNDKGIRKLYKKLFKEREKDANRVAREYDSYAW